MAKDIRIIPASGQINVTGSADFKGTGNTSVLFITGSGGVGINTTDPSDDLHVAGTFRATAVTGNRIGNGTDITKALSILDTGMTAGDTNVISLGRNAANNNQAELTFHLAQTGSTSNRLQLGLYNSADTLNILGSGKVGVGTTLPRATFEVATPATTNISNGIRINRPSTSYYHGFELTTGTTVDWSIGQNNRGGLAIYENGSDASTRLIIKDGGNIGIGTNAPSDKIHMYGSGTDQFLKLENTATFTGIWMQDSGDNNGWLLMSGYTNSASPGDFVIREYGVQSSLIIKQSTGRVGISNPSPVYQLDVSGSTRVLNGSLLLDSSTVNGTSNRIIRFTEGTGTSAQLQGAFIQYNADSNRLNFGVHDASDSNVNNDVVVLSLKRSDNSIRFDQYGSGNFTGSAAYTLQVDSSGNVIENPIGAGAVDGTGATNYLTRWEDADTITTSSVYETGTNIGIGTTVPTAKVDIYNSGSLVFNVRGSQGQLFSVTDSLQGSLMSVNDISGLPILEVFDTDKVVMGTFGENTLVVTGSSVGIGTNVPSYPLDVKGKVRLDSAETVPTNAKLLVGSVQNAGSSAIAQFGGFIRLSDGVYIHKSGDITQSFQVGYGTNGLRIRREGGSGNANILLAEDNGDVGIGVTNPSTKLQVNGDWVNNYGSINISHSANTLGGLGLRANGVYKGGLIYRDGTAGTYWELSSYQSEPFLFRTNNTERMRIKEDGNIGINVTSPEQKLHLSGNFLLQNNNEIRSKDTGGTQRTITRVNSSNELEFGWSGNGPVKFMGGGAYTERMRITTDGDITINQNLTVEGIVTAKEFHTQFVSASIIYQSGSTQFGDTTDDNHKFTGSLEILTDTLAGNRTFIVDGQSGPRLQRRGDTSGWAYEYGFNANDGTNLGGFGAFSNDPSDIVRYYIGIYSSNERVSILDNGNVGLGYTAPDHKLKVGGSIYANSVSYANAGFRTTEANTGYTVLSRDSSGNATLYVQAATTTTNQPIARFYYGDATPGAGTEVLNVAKEKSYFRATNLGVGTTNPTFTLDVFGKLAVTSGSAIGDYVTNHVALRRDTAGGAQLDAPGDITLNIDTNNNQTTAKVVITKDGGTELVRVQESGDIGVGTTSPDGRVHAKSAGNSKYIFRAQSSGGTDLGGIYQNGSGNGEIYLKDSSVSTNVRFSTDSSIPSYINAGSVGIGTNSPTPALHLVYTGGTYSTDATSGFINQADSGRATMRLRSVTDAPAELFFDVSGSIRWDISTRGSSDDFDLMFFPQAATPALNAVGSHTFKLAQNGDVIVTGAGSSGKMGIGTASPSNRLHIQDTGNGSVVRVTNASNTFYLGNDSNGGYLQPAANGMSMYGPNGTKYVYVDNSGVGINTRSVTHTLTVNGTFKSVGITDNADATAITINGNEEVGIGTGSPLAKLHVYGGGNTIFEGPSATNIDVRYRSAGTNVYNMFYQASSDSWALYHNVGSAYRIFVSGSGNVGIGNTSPGYKLDVSGTGRFTGELRSDYAVQVTDIDGAGNIAPGTDFARFSGYGIIGNRGTFYITNTSGNVQIGAGGTHNASPVATFKNTGQVQLHDYGQGNYTANSVYRLAVDINGNIIEESLGDGAINGLGASRYMARWVDTDSLTTSSMYEDESGQIGINTTTPQSDLDVAGTLTLSIPKWDSGASFSNMLVMSGSGPGERHAMGVGTGVFTHFAEQGGTLKNMVSIKNDGSEMYFGYEAATEVGVGTSSPSYKFEVQASKDSNLLSRFYNTSTTNGQGLLIRAGETNAANRVLQVASRDDTKIMTVNSNGRVGIGTISPGYTFEVIGNARIDSTLTVADTGTANSYIYLLSSASGESELRMGDSDTDAGSIAYNNAADTMKLRTGGSDRVYIDSSGNVGIGSASPINKLDVDGAATIGGYNADSVKITIGTHTDSFQTSFPLITSNNHSDFTFGVNLRLDSNHQLITNNDHNSLQGSAIVLGGNGYDLGANTIAFFAQPATTATAGTVVSASYARMVIDNGGCVGIGTTNPIYRLDVESGASSQAFGLSLSGTERLKMYADGTWNYFEAKSGQNHRFTTTGGALFTVMNNGNLGINTASPYAPLHIKETGTPTTGGQQGYYGKLVLEGDDGYWNRLRFDTEGTGSWGVASDPNRKFVISRLDSSFTGVPDDDNFVIDTNGKVGIGTASPTATLEVSSGQSDLRVTSTTGGESARLMVKTTTREWRLGTFQSQGDNFWVYDGTAGAYRMAIDTSGNVGIGTTSVSGKLHVHGSDPIVYISSNASGESSAIYFDEANTGNINAQIFWSGSDNKMHFRTYTSGDVMTITDSGRVGISTISPNTELEVAGTIRAEKLESFNGGRFATLHDGNSPGINLSDNLGDLNWVIGADDRGGVGQAGQNAIVIRTNRNSVFTDSWVDEGTEVFTLDDSGNLGLGVVAPTYKLDVAGNIRTTGTVTVQTNPTDHSGSNWYSIADSHNIVEVTDGRDVYIEKEAGASGYGYFTITPEEVGLNFDISFRLRGGTPSGYRHLAVAIGNDGTNTTSNFDYVVLRHNTANSANNQIRIDVAGTTQQSLVGTSVPDFFDGVERHILIQVRNKQYVVEVDGVVEHAFEASARTSTRGFVGFAIYETAAADTWVEIGDFNITQYSNSRTILPPNVGVGTYNPVSDFHVNGDKIIFTQTGQNYTDGSSGLTGIGIRNTGTSAAYNALGVETGVGSIFQVRNDGHVRVGRGGTDDRDAYLIIDGGSGGSGEAFLSLQRNSTQQFLLNTTNTETQVRNTGNLPIHFYTNDSQRLTIAADGNVGIGSNSPGAKLDVAGTVRLGVMTGYQETGAIVISRDDGTDRSHRIVGYNTNVAADNYLRFDVHNGNVSSYQTALTLRGDGSSEFAGDLTVDGILTAREFHTTFVSASIIYQSGSTQFGDTSDDEHDFTGQVHVYRNATIGSPASFTAANAGLRIQDNANSMYFDGNAIVADGAGNFEVGTTQNTGMFLFTNGSERMRIASDGKVGIGTTAPSSGSLQIYNTAGTNDIVFDGGVSTANSYIGAFAGGMYLSTNYSYASGHRSDKAGLTSMEMYMDHDVIHIASMPAGSPGSRTRVMTISGSQGYVGIGSSNPGYKLDVADAARIDGVRMGRDFSINNRATVRLDANGNAPADILFGQTAAANETSWNGVYWSISSRDSGAGATQGNKFTIWRGSEHASPNNSENQFLTITPDLKMGIGNTTPSYKLTVAGEIYGTALRIDSGGGNSIRIGDDFGGGGTATIHNNGQDLYLQYNAGMASSILRIGGGGTGVSIKDQENNNYQIGTNATSSYLAYNSGCVGIGTNTPATKLHVKDNAQVLTIDGTNHVYEAWSIAGTRKAYAGFASAGTTAFTIFNEYNGAFIFGTNNTERMRITGGGDVGIGTISPSAKLEVAGNIERRGSEINPGAMQLGTKNYTLAYHWTVDEGAIGTNTQVRTNTHPTGTGTVTAMGRSTSLSSGAAVITIPNNKKYRKVYGYLRVRGQGSMDGWRNSSATIDSNEFMDGIAITGFDATGSNETWIWGVVMNNYDAAENVGSKPSFVGDNYQTFLTSHGTTETNYWNTWDNYDDNAGRSPVKSFYFEREIPSDLAGDIEVRLMSDQSSVNNEDVGLEEFAIYVAPEKDSDYDDVVNIGIGTPSAPQRLTVDGNISGSGRLYVGTVDNAASDTDKFLVLNGEEVEYRTGAQVLSDIGGVSGVTWPQVGAGERENYNLGFKAPSSGYAGFYFETPTGNADAGYFLIRGGADSSVYKENGITLVADASWLTLAQRTSTTAGIRFMTGQTATERMVIANGGNVGIGTASPASTLHIKGPDIATRTTTTAVPVLRLVRDVVDGSFPSTKDSAVDFMLSRQQAVNNNLPYTRLDIRLAGTTDSSTPTLDVMSLLHDGNVGIGTTAPSDKLHVVGNALFDGGRDVFINSALGNVTISAPSSGGWATGMFFKDAGGNDAGGFGTYGDATSLNYYFIGDAYNDTTMAIEPNAGNVGIGITNPSAKLHVVGNGEFYSGIGANDNIRTGLAHYDTTAQAAGVGGQLVLGYKYTDAGAYTEGAILKMYKATGTSGQYGSGLKFQVRNHGDNLSTKMTLDPSGNLGVGETSPSTKLHVVKTAVATKYIDAYSTAVIEDTEARLQLIASDGGGNAAAVTLSNGSNHWSMHHKGPTAGNYLAFGYASTTNTTDIVNNTNSGIALALTTAGNVGIGTTAPGEKLEVYSATDSVGIKIRQNGGTNKNPYILIDGEAGRAGYIRMATNNTASAQMNFYASDDASSRVWSINEDANFGDSTADIMLMQDGNVGIGVTNPSAKLEINGNVYGSTTGQFGNSYINGTQSGWALFGSNSTSNGIKVVLDGNVSRNDIVVATTGNVGINTSTPSARLDVYQSGSIVFNVGGSQGQLFSVTDSLVGSLMSVNDISGIPILEVFDTDKVVMGTFGANTLVVTGSNVGIGTDTPAANARMTVMGNTTFGLPGNGTNTSGRFISIEGNTDTNGEGSGRVFFTEHNSTTANMDNYGMSIGYRGGSTSVTTAGGNTWSGLADIGNGQWGMWGHDNSTNGALIMYGDRGATFVNFAGNDIQGVNDLYVADQIIHTGDTNTYMQFHANDQWRVVTAGSERLEVGTNVRISNAYSFPNSDGTSGQALVTDGNGNLSFGTVSGGSASSIDVTNTTSGTGYRVLFIDDTGTSGETIYVQDGGLEFDPGTSDLNVKGNVVSYATSDGRLKDNLTPIENALDKISQVSGYEFDWNDKQASFTGHDVGIVAQEIETILPEVVTERDNGYKAVKYEKIVPLLIEGIKEQKDIVEKQQKEIDELKSELKAIRDMLLQKP